MSRNGPAGGRRQTRHDGYLSPNTDTEEEAQQRAELNRARKLAQQRMDRHEAHERARAFAVLDNVSERESPSWREMKTTSRSKFDPALNPHIDHEAVEAGDSDSDVQRDNDSFIASDSSVTTVSTVENGSCGEEKKGGSGGIQHTHHGILGQEKATEFAQEDGSDDRSEEADDTLYDDFAASREVVEAQIDADEKKRKRYQFCDSTDEEESTSSSNQDEEASHSSTLETEEEASFSSI